MVEYINIVLIVIVYQGQNEYSISALMLRF